MLAQLFVLQYTVTELAKIYVFINQPDAESTPCFTDAVVTQPQHEMKLTQ